MIAALDAKHLPDPHVECIRNAVIVPVQQDGLVRHAVYRPDGSPVDHARTLLSRQRFSEQADLPAPDKIDHLPGRHLFGGLGRRHFGHFLMETMTRFWAIDVAHTDIHSVLFVALYGSGFGTTKMAYPKLYGPLTQLTPHQIVDRPIRVDELLVPTQGIGHLHWAEASAPYRQITRDRLSAAFAPDGPTRLYLSRSRLSGDAALVDKETQIEDLMTKAGYTIFHPQDHALDVQCRAYRAARYIVGPDGSALHLVPYLASVGTHVAIFQRRPRRAVFQAIVRQNRAFLGTGVTAITPLTGTDTNPTGPHEIDLTRLTKDLDQAGML